MSESRIKVLPDDLVNKIAAGEVVERPASVVKELAENAIDAGADRIIVEIRNAGKKMIRVSDNGSGMSEDEIKLALERHSTSKLSSQDDLFNIKTLGFRGEALPSIASVSRLKIERNHSGRGVTVDVEDLFYNTPARLKFLKSDPTEIGHAGDFISKYALAYPERSFEFISNGAVLLRTAGSGKLIDAVVSVFGAELARELIEIDHPFASGRIKGYISRPTMSRIDKNLEIFFVNGRYIKNFLLNRALEEGFRTLIPGNRYPAAIIMVDIDPRKVDVNVHPTKREVKFQKTQEVMDAVTAAVREALAKVVEVGSWDTGKDAGMDIGSMSREVGSYDQLPMSNFYAGISTQIPTSNFSQDQPLAPIFQFKQTYIVATDGNELIMIDQHAAHERILFDRLSKQAEVQLGTADKQVLLLPETVEFDPQASQALSANLGYLNELGFEIEAFGGNTFILRSVPAVAVKISAKQLLTDIVSELGDADKTDQPEIKKEELRKLVACHSAIKAGDSLTSQEISQLICDLYATANPFTCPHGRPTLIRITEAELAARFGR
jgi:DNA mismatch repair protein MutL